MSMYLVRLGTMVLFVNPSMSKLYIWRDEHGWVQPIFMRVWQRGGIRLAVMKRAAIYNFYVEEMTNFMIWERVRSGLLLTGMGMFSEIKMWQPTRLRALISSRKDALD